MDLQVREWTQYSLVCKAWQAAFEDIHLCIEFHEVSPSWLLRCMTC